MNFLWVFLPIVSIPLIQFGSERYSLYQIYTVPAVPCNILIHESIKAEKKNKSTLLKDGGVVVVVVVDFDFFA